MDSSHAIASEPTSSSGSIVISSDPQDTVSDFETDVDSTIAAESNNFASTAPPEDNDTSNHSARQTASQEEPAQPSFSFGKFAPRLMSISKAVVRPSLLFGMQQSAPAGTGEEAESTDGDEDDDTSVLSNDGKALLKQDNYEKSQPADNVKRSLPHDLAQHVSNAKRVRVEAQARKTHAHARSTSTIQSQSRTPSVTTRVPSVLDRDEPSERTAAVPVRSKLEAHSTSVAAPDRQEMNEALQIVAHTWAKAQISAGQRAQSLAQDLHATKLALDAAADENALYARQTEAQAERDDRWRLKFNHLKDIVDDLNSTIRTLRSEADAQHEALAQEQSKGTLLHAATEKLEGQILRRAKRTQKLSTKMLQAMHTMGGQLQSSQMAAEYLLMQLDEKTGLLVEARDELKLLRKHQLDAALSGEQLAEHMDAGQSAIIERIDALQSLPKDHTDVAKIIREAFQTSSEAREVESAALRATISDLATRINDWATQRVETGAQTSPDDLHTIQEGLEELSTAVNAHNDACDTVKSLKAELTELRTTLGRKDGLIAELESKANAMRVAKDFALDESDLLKHDLNELAIRRNFTSQQCLGIVRWELTNLRAMQRRHDRLCAEHRTTEVESVWLTDKLSRLSGQKTTARKNLGILEQELLMLRREQEYCMDEQDEVVEQHEDCEATCEGLKEQLAATEKRLTEDSAKILHLGCQKDDYEAQVKKLKSDYEIETSNKLRDLTVAHQEDLIAHTSHHSKQLHDLQAQLDAALKHGNELHEQGNVMRASRDQAQDSLESMATELNDLRDELKIALHQQEERIEQLRAIATERDSARDGLKSMIDQHDQNVHNTHLLEQELSSFQAQLRAAKSREEESFSALVLAEAAIAETEAARALDQSKLQSNCDQPASMGPGQVVTPPDDRISCLEDTIDDLNAALRKAEDERMQSIQKEQVFREKVQKTWKKEQAKHDNELTSVRTAHNQLEAEMLQIDTKTVELTEELAAARQTIQDLEASIANKNGNASDSMIWQSALFGDHDHDRQTPDAAMNELYSFLSAPRGHTLATASQSKLSGDLDLSSSSAVLLSEANNHPGSARFDRAIRTQQSSGFDHASELSPFRRASQYGTAKKKHLENSASRVDFNDMLLSSGSPRAGIWNQQADETALDANSRKHDRPTKAGAVALGALRGTRRSRPRLAKLSKQKYDERLSPEL